MTRRQSTSRSDMVELRFGVPSLQLPDAASTAEMVMSKAMEYCADKMGLSSEQAIEALRRHEDQACKYCQYSIAKQVAGALGALDEHVQAVYVCDYDATAEDLCFGDSVPSSPIHMIIWTDRKTKALLSLVEGLDRSLASKQAELLGSEPAALVLDAQVIDDADVEARAGYGALIASVHNPPLKVWTR